MQTVSLRQPSQPVCLRPTVCKSRPSSIYYLPCPGTGASNGSRGLFHAGNIVGTNYRTNVEYVTIASPGNAADFGDLTVASRGQEGLAGSPS